MTLGSFILFADASLWGRPQGVITPIKSVIHGTLYTVQARLVVWKMVRGVVQNEHSTAKSSQLRLCMFLPDQSCV